MTAEQIIMRQEIRQMLNEAGINKNTLKDMVKEVLGEEINKAVRQALNERDFESETRKRVDSNFDKIIRDIIKESVVDRTRSVFNRMTISVDITDEHGSSSTVR